MWLAPQRLVGRSITLEPLDRSHAADLFAAADPELFRHTPQAPPEWTIVGFEREIDDTTGMSGVVAFAMVLNATGRAVGRTTFMHISPERRSVEIGRTWIGRAHQGTCVNPEAKYLMLRHAFERLEPPAIRVQLTTGGSNIHSRCAIAKLGAVCEGVLRNARIVPQGPDPDGPPVVGDTVVFSIVDREWPAVRDRLLARIESARDIGRTVDAPAPAQRPRGARAGELVARLGLRPHPEGGWYRETFRSDREVIADDDRGRRRAMTTIHFLLAAGERSRWHRVRSDEAWHVLEGEGLELLVADPTLTRIDRVELGPVDRHRRPDHVVPAGHWQAARPIGDHALCACTVGPGFEFDDFELLADDERSVAALRTSAPERLDLV